jgi:hypothetical protein
MKSRVDESDTEGTGGVCLEFLCIIWVQLFYTSKLASHLRQEYLSATEGCGTHAPIIEGL